MTDSYSVTSTSVVLLAAGHGTRMLPLTANTPKPLLKVGNLSLIEHHITRLAQQGFRHIVINVAYLGEQIEEKLGDGRKYNVDIDYSNEVETGALETAGGLKQALPLIKSDPFIVVNADIWTDFDFTSLLFPLSHKGRLVMVNNPEHNSEGDFAIDASGMLSKETRFDKKTFSGIACYTKVLFEQLPEGKQALGPIFSDLIHQRDLEGVEFNGGWIDIGTPERLDEINRSLLGIN